MSIGKSPTSASHTRWLKATIFSITNQDMLNYLALEYATSLVDMKELRWYWKTKDTCSNLLGNDFFKNTMSMNKFLIIRRGFQADFKGFMEHYNRISQQYYEPALRVSFDDDLDKCESKSSEDPSRKESVWQLQKL
jgi:hypothetical protein